MDIPEIDTRLDCWQLKLSFAQKYTDIKDRHQHLLSACNEILTSSKFAIVLEVILTFGNFLNFNSSRGGAWGFRIDSLMRLAEIKTRSDAEKTMLFFVIEYLQQEYPDTIDFYHDFKSLDKAKEIQQTASLLNDIQLLETGVKKIEEFSQSPAAECGKFKSSVEAFIPNAKTKIQRLREIYKKANESYLELLNYFGEPKTTPTGTYFGTLQSFIVHFERTKFNMVKKATAARKGGMQAGKLPSVPSQGTLDKVIAGLKSGEAYS